MELLDIGLMNVLLIIGVCSLLLAVVGFGLTLWTKDRRTIALGVLLMSIAILLFASLYMDYHVGKATLEQEYETATKMAESIEDLGRILRLFLGMSGE